ncbi:SUMO-specific isopeptidase USPL1 isoform X2 [Pseudophryne corroboree]|uniref:SUMO-specific isopeptidase USPL1 isoform X2 n=1 Tax=Pseudophryne corroboree TaxID=495146 RepID=UPI0030817248
MWRSFYRRKRGSDVLANAGSGTMRYIVGAGSVHVGFTYLVSRVAGLVGACQCGCVAVRRPAEHSTQNTNAFKTPPDGCCPVCKSKGQSQALQTYRINFTESIFLCSNQQCIFPLGYTPLDNIIVNTVDLKKSSSPSKTKKRNISELSPTPHPSEKRTKIDLPILWECLPRNGFSSAQCDQGNIVPVLPTLACDVSPIKTSQHYPANDRKIQVENVSEAANSFSSFPSGLCEDPTSPSVPMGLRNGKVCDQSESPLADQDMLQERVLPNEVVEMDMLDNGFLYHCEKPETEALEKLSETGRTLRSECKEQETLKLNSEIVNTEHSNGDPGVLKYPAFTPDHVLSIKATTQPPLLQCHLLPSQVKENSPKMVSSPAFSIVDVGPDLGNDSVLESGLPLSCAVVQDSLCEKVEGCLLQDNRPRQQAEDIRAVVNVGCAEDPQDTLTTICEITASPGVQESNGNILPNLYSPPIALVGAVDENHVDTAVSPLKHGLSKHDGCEIALPTKSLQDMQQVFPAEDGSLDVYELTCTNAAVAQDSAVERTAASWKVCHLSQQKHLVEGKERSQCGTDTPSQLLEHHRPLQSLSKEESLLCASDASRTRDSIRKYSGNVSVAHAALPGSSFAGEQMVQDCQTSSNETPNSVQDLLLDFQSEEKSLRDLCNSPVTAVNDQPSVDSAAESLQKNRMSGLLDLVYGCQSNNITKPPDSLEELQPVCHLDTSSLLCVCDTPCTAAAVVKDGINVGPDVASLLVHSLPDLQNLTHDCPKTHCVISTPSLGIQTAPHMYDHSTLDVNGSSCDITADLDNCDNADTTSGPQGPDNHFLNSLMDSCETTVMPESQINSVLDKEIRSSCDTGVPMEDDGTVRPPISDFGVSMCKLGTKKTFYENTVLPDLLLDIQPEHRMEEPLVATAPSPACRVLVSPTPLSDAEPIARGDLLQDKSKLNDSTEISRAVTNYNGLHDVSTLSETLSLKTSLNTDSLSQGESMDATSVESKQAPKTPGGRTFKNTQRCLQWRNKHSLCWLDCILSALVQSDLLSNFVAKGDKALIIHYLFERYEEASSMLTQSTKKVKPRGTSTFEKSLNEVRMYVFDKLKPFLKCELGQKESPVFAFPLLLKQDPEVEKLFVHNYTWNFKCELCGYSYQDSCQKTLTTFTKVVPGWRPLNALHTAPCNKCHDANQKRSMDLEKLHSVFMVHFVEGLPTNDLEEYSFQFKGHLYEISTVIRYRYDHFSTWIANDDGTWLESDDLKGLFCRRHQKFRVRAEDIHVVMWERRNARMPGEEDTQLGAAGHENPELNAANHSTSLQDHNLDLAASTNTPTHVVLAAGSGDRNNSNPLAGMEGYADDDIITLTLVEIPLDAMGKPIVDTCAAELDASQVVSPQATPLKVPSDPLPLPHPKDQSPGTYLSPICTSPTAKTVSPMDCKVLKSPVGQNNMTKPAFNMQATAIATSTPAPQLYSTKKSAVGSWMMSLISKDHSLLNSSLCGTNKRKPSIKPCPPLKVTEINGIPKKAQNFDGFQTKRVNKTAGSMGSTVFQSTANPLSLSTPKKKTTPPDTTFLTPAAPGLLKHGSNGLNHSKLMKDGSSSSEDKIRKLRLKLLKKLKAKKNELATLERMAKIQQSQPCSDQSDAIAQGRLNRREHLRGFLQELQDQIDNADNESVCTMSSTTSICSSPGDAEFFAELFSPPPMDNPANDSQYLEMLADGYGLSTDQSQQANGHNLPMDSSFSQQSTSGSNSCLKTGTPDRSVGEESLNFMSSSTLAMLNEDTEYFPPFDYIF